ncbi:MAG: 3,4-dihydroxy-2-butanone-4-phosphate synthase [Acidobacteriaceae bacterium]
MLSFPSIATALQSAAFPFEERFHRALDDIRLGRPIILVDDFDRENEADMIVAAETISVPTMALLIREGSGIVCLCLTDEALTRLNLPQMVSNNESCFQTSFTVTIDAREGVTTGVSAQDRVTTIRTAVETDAQPRDLVRPGHVFPLRATPGGVLARQGHTEGSVDLARMAGMKPASVLCEITNPDGTMAKGDDVDQFARRHGFVMLSIAELVDYHRCHTETRATINPFQA